MYDIFLSYSTQDRERLMPLVRALEQQGWTVFWDHRSIPPGKNWHDMIGDAIRVCRSVVVVWSKHSVNSNWVKEEALEGRERNVLFPVLWDGTPQPFGFKLIQSVDFVGWNGKADYPELEKLSTQLGLLLGGKKQPSKPAWASVVGDDPYGYYADVTVSSIIQRFRQIKPGTFLMGSPPSEPGRYNDETQHEVTLTQGFWLADTTCTQALWQAVMGNNPANFKDSPNNPVETVSWNEVQGFIQKLNPRVAGLQARLPTEAEWEYACRAGTSSAFSFGGKDDLSLKRVNYSGMWDGYDPNGKTKPVKTYPPNPWGLHEMHGNVWEWCQDCFGSYPAEPITNPEGSQVGAHRVLRGGSWLHDGRDCRSAARGRNDPAFRLDIYGFRLALGL